LRKRYRHASLADHQHTRRGVTVTDDGLTRHGEIGDDEIEQTGRRFRYVAGFAYAEPGGFQGTPRGNAHDGIAVDDKDRNHRRDRSGALHAAQRTSPHPKRCRLNLWYGVLSYFQRR
jgi:hypothetical protein